MAMVAPQPPLATLSDPIIFDRVTQIGRKLFYRLEVIQQPERARACGSGPKSCADRRPVDPPPVVELRIFEGGPTIETSKDITFGYSANFFLFATLEHARVTAHCRGQGQAANTPPILTGMPVSGMAYLDRPREAGYFLFPDLSVRHEGFYRLAFNLYEQTKEPSDRDAAPELGDDNIPEESFDWRMEIKSKDFQVYSAKKFPGLTESTPLSRTVAEQGCRVRIRRDIRMRRREPKQAGGGDNFENPEGENRRRRATKTPEPERHRSISRESSHRAAYQPQDVRRMSGHSSVDYPPPPPSFRGAHHAGGHLSFGSQAAAHYQPPSFTTASNPHPPSVPASPSFGPSYAGPYSHQQPYPSPAQSNAYSDRPPTSHYSTMNPSPKPEPYSQDYRRVSTSNSLSRPSPHRIPDSDEKIEVDPHINPTVTLPPIGSIPACSPIDSRLSPMQPNPMESHYAPAGNKRDHDDYSQDAALYPEYAQKNGARQAPPLCYDHEWHVMGQYPRANGKSRHAADRPLRDLTPVAPRMMPLYGIAWKLPVPVTNEYTGPK